MNTLYIYCTQQLFGKQTAVFPYAKIRKISCHEVRLAIQVQSSASQATPSLLPPSNDSTSCNLSANTRIQHHYKRLLKPNHCEFQNSLTDYSHASVRAEALPKEQSILSQYFGHCHSESDTSVTIHVFFHFPCS